MKPKGKALKYLKEESIGFIITDSWDEGGKYKSWTNKYVKKAIEIALKEQAKQIYVEIEKELIRENRDYGFRYSEKKVKAVDFYRMIDIIKELKEKHLKQ